MSRQPDERPVEARADAASEPHSSGPPTLPEDLLLLLFRPEHGVIAGHNGRRAGLVKDVRDVLLDGKEPTARTSALAALIWGHGTLHRFDPEIPWNSS
ncbi:hypothetical protein ACH4KU_23540 [Streptomyces althioticus]|uniref:hypothetical protein n=1 Tax=Streptomyces TaxID=1883 RepID=UPI0036F88DD2